MYTCIAILLFACLVFVAYVWAFVGLVLAIIVPFAIGIFTWFVLRDPFLTPNSDGRFLVFLSFVIFLFIEFALFLGELPKILKIIEG